MSERWKKSDVAFTVLDVSTDVPWPVFSIVKRADGTINFIEGCDSYYEVDMTKDEAKRLLQEAIVWLDEPIKN